MDDFVFSWAQDATGRMVHVDSVPRGIRCGCICPHCKEPLYATHGEVYAHHFAHHSQTRKATLEICYAVILYKVAEHLVQTHKKIHAPSYYGIFPEQDIEFSEVRVDSQYERYDKQPDVIATGIDGKEYLIEFVFAHKVQHKQPLDYKNLTCLEIDLARQNLQTIEKFLFTSNEDRKWLNNENYFSSIEELYRRNRKEVHITPDMECINCPIRYECIGVRLKDSPTPLVIENDGHKYRLCKPQLYDAATKAAIRKAELEAQEKKEREEYLAEQYQKREEQKRISRNIVPGQRSCFNCISNLDWRSLGGMASCGQGTSLRLPKRHSPNVAINCPRFREKY